eukprot:6053174-Amphidinium_carterae.1
MPSAFWGILHGFDLSFSRPVAPEMRCAQPGGYQSMGDSTSARCSRRMQRCVAAPCNFPKTVQCSD